MFESSSIWLSPITQECTTERLIRKVNYNKDGMNLLVDTPLLEIEDVLLVRDSVESFRILIRAKQVVESPPFCKVVADIDAKLVEQAGFVGSHRFWPSMDAGVLHLFIPIYRGEVSVPVIRTGESESLQSLKKGVRCRMMLVLSHVESTSQLFFPVWNVIQIRVRDKKS